MAVFSHKARGPRTQISQGPKMNVYDLGKYQRDYNKWRSTLENEKAFYKCKIVIIIVLISRKC